MSLALLASGCGAGLHFRRAHVLGSHYDEATKAQKVKVSFEVWNDDVQLTQLSRESFSVSEDRQPATSESLNDAANAEVKVPLILVLDTSLSMYQANAVGALKAAAQKFISSIEARGFQVSVLRFASTIERVPGVPAVADTFDQGGGERWTSLYAAVQQAMSMRRDAVIVVFSDGADNYSQNHGVPGADAILSRVRPADEMGTGEERVVHTIGFGNVASERDKEGRAAVEVLQELARNGSFHLAADSRAFDAIFDDVARRIRNVYIYEYFSPNLNGTHELVVHVRVGDATASTMPMFFGEGIGRDLNAWVKPDGALGFRGEQMLVAQAVELANRCAEAPSSSGAEAACRDFDEFMQANSDANSVRASRSWLQTNACIGHPGLSICAGGGSPSTTLGPPPTPVFAPPPGSNVDCSKLLEPGANLQALDRGCAEFLAQLPGGRLQLCTLDPTLPFCPNTQAPAGAATEGGVGLRLGEHPGGIQVEALVPNGAAEAGGIRVGDVITHVDDRALGDLPFVEAIRLFRGPVDSSVRLRGFRSDGSELSAELIRRKPAP